VTQAEHRINLIVGERPVRGGDCAQHVGIQVDLVKRHGVVEAIVEVISHRFTSVTIAGPARDDCQGTGRGRGLA
jgi:hypothetical protein